MTAVQRGDGPLSLEELSRCTARMVTEFNPLVTCCSHACCSPLCTAMSSRQSCTPPGQLFKHVVQMVEGLGEEGPGHEQRPEVDEHYEDTVQINLPSLE